MKWSVYYQTGCCKSHLWFHCGLGADILAGTRPFGGIFTQLQLQTALCSAETSGVPSCSLYIQDQLRISP